ASGACTSPGRGLGCGLFAARRLGLAGRPGLPAAAGVTVVRWWRWTVGRRAVRLAARVRARRGLVRRPALTRVLLVLVLALGDDLAAARPGARGADQLDDGCVSRGVLEVEGGADMRRGGGAAGPGHVRRREAGEACALGLGQSLVHVACTLAPGHR